MAQKLHRLGKNDSNIPPMDFGLMTIAGAHGNRPSEEEQYKLLDHAVDLGDTFWDTSDIYSDNLEVLGKWCKRTGKRDQIFLASKFGLIMGENLTLKGFDSSAEYCKKACNDSLKRLGVDCIDLYYVHHINPETPIEETMRAMVELQAGGKIKHIGLCALSSYTLRRACKVAPVAAVQVEYSVFVTDIERENGTNLLETFRQLGVAVVCFGAIGRGLLTGNVTGSGSIAEGDIRTNCSSNLAEKKGCTSTQLALAWILKKGAGFFPVPGTKNIKYLESNWAAIDIELSDVEGAEIRRLVADSELAGFEVHPSAYVDTKEMA